MKLILYFTICCFSFYSYSADIQRVATDKINQLNCNLISTEIKKNPDSVGKFYNCEGYLLVEEDDRYLSLIDPKSETLRQKVVTINDKDVSASDKTNTEENLHSIFRLTAFWNSSIKDQKLKMQMRDFFIKAREKNILNKSNQAQFLKKSYHC